MSSLKTKTKYQCLSYWHIKRPYIVPTHTTNWLIASLQRDMCLCTTDFNHMEKLRQDILKWLSPSSRQISRKTGSETYQVIFEMNWDILAFLETQDYKDLRLKTITSRLESLQRALTLTGRYLFILCSFLKGLYKSVYRADHLRTGGYRVYHRCASSSLKLLSRSDMASDRETHDEFIGQYCISAAGLGRDRYVLALETIFSSTVFIV
jgi:hypothetical protein